MVNQYTLQVTMDIAFNGFDIQLPDSTIKLIEGLTSQVGSPTYIKTPNFQKKEIEPYRFCGARRDRAFLEKAEAEIRVCERLLQENHPRIKPYWDQLLFTAWPMDFMANIRLYLKAYKIISPVVKECIARIREIDND